MKRMDMNRIVLHASLLIMFAFSFSAEAQKVRKPVDPKEAEEKFKLENYKGALEDYLYLISQDPKNNKYNFNIGVCYLITNIDKKKAVPYLEKAVKSDKPDPEAMYMLGRAYQYAGRYDDAINAFTKYKEKKKKEELAEAEQQIHYCQNAKELIKYPIDISFENLGRNVNSEFPDYGPFVPADESFMLYSTRRLGPGTVMDLNGMYTADIYISKTTDGIFQKAKTIGPPVNTSTGDEEVVGLSPSGETMLMYYDNAAAFGDIYSCEGDKKLNFKKPELLGKNVNTAELEKSATLTSSGNTLYFSSDRKGGFGGTDIYISKKLPNGEWGPALNLGEEINTAFDEDFPNISSDEKTLYFSSKGHTSMGGFDIFKAAWDDNEKKWKGHINVGYPLNTAEDNMNFRISANGRYGYISALRQDGLGDLDIYRVTFNDIPPDFIVVKGVITSIDTTKKINGADVAITVTDSKTGDLFGTYIPSSTGRYIIIVPPSSYEVTFEISGYKTLNEKLEIMDKTYKTEVEKNIILEPEGYKSNAPLPKTPENKAKPPVKK
jgi:TPR repeat protein